MKKDCTTCGIFRQLSEFSKGTGRCGRRAACKLCLNKVAKAYRQSHRSENLRRSREDYKNNKKIRLAQNRKWAVAHPEKVKKSYKLWLKNHPDGPSRYNRKYNYGLSFEQQRDILSKPCGICEEKSTVIDHDHLTGKVRGGLCRRCNSGLGMLRDNVELLKRAIAYLT
jgi:recombination endonuclease VII